MRNVHAVFRLVTLSRVALRGAHALALFEGELDDRTRRAMEVILRHKEVRRGGISNKFTDRSP